jgi:hypothetical protein
MGGTTKKEKLPYVARIVHQHCLCVEEIGQVRDRHHLVSDKVRLEQRLRTPIKHIDEREGDKNPQKKSRP